MRLRRAFSFSAVRDCMSSSRSAESVTGNSYPGAPILLQCFFHWRSHASAEGSWGSEALAFLLMAVLGLGLVLSLKERIHFSLPALAPGFFPLPEESRSATPALAADGLSSGGS